MALCWYRIALCGKMGLCGCVGIEQLYMVKWVCVALCWYRKALCDTIGLCGFVSVLNSLYMTLTFNLPEHMFQMALLLLKQNNCAKLSRYPCVNVEVMVLTITIYDLFIT